MPVNLSLTLCFFTLKCDSVIFQAFTEEIQYKQAELDQVNEKAQSLLQTNADAKTSHAITQLTTRYQGVIALSKVCSRHIIVINIEVNTRTEILLRIKLI
jgi:hypothetical protein